MKLRDRVALRIRTIRKRRGLTQNQLAEGISRSGDAVSQLERGISLPSFETLERLSLALDSPVRDFFDTERDGQISALRAERITILLDLARQMTDQELQTAVQVLEAMTTKRTRSARKS